MNEELELIVNPDYDYSPRPNPKAKKAMRIAGDLRSEGWDASSALKEGWSQVGGGSDDVLAGGSSLLLLIGAGIVGWRLWKGQWPWENWSIQGMRQRQAIARQRIQAQLQRQKQDNSNVVSTGLSRTITMRPYNPSTGEGPVQMIEP